MANKVTKTLVTKFNTDVSQLGDAQIDALKAFYVAVYKEAGLELSFELLLDDEEERSLDLYQHMQKEFKVAELTTPPPTAPQRPAKPTQKKSGNPFAGLSKLFGELGELLEDGEEGA